MDSLGYITLTKQKTRSPSRFLLNGAWTKLREAMREPSTDWLLFGENSIQPPKQQGTSEKIECLQARTVRVRTGFRAVYIALHQQAGSDDACVPVFGRFG
ncbi:hypothetical protein M758_5G043200 [Ceratodon purpureus]|nr:hypothetical protein M758_5G043200 [Ceratodon purpureus]